MALRYLARSKLAIYDSRVEYFRHAYGIPSPEAMVPLVGICETAMR